MPDMQFTMKFQVNTGGQFVGVAEMTGAVALRKPYSIGNRTGGMVPLLSAALTKTCLAIFSGTSS